MPLLFDKNSILETIRQNPERAGRVWIEAGYERAADQIIKEARGHAIPFKVLPKDAFSRKFKGARFHVCLERNEFLYTDPDVLLAGIDMGTRPLLCAFDAIFDPHNFGNIIRSAACFGAEAIIIPKDRSCAITDTVMTVAKGGLEHVKVIKVVNLARYLDELKDLGIFCYGLDEAAEGTLMEIDLTGPVCLVFGSEEGLRRLTKEKCDSMARVPTAELFPSLNVANAFAISMYEVKRQRFSRQSGT